MTSMYLTEQHRETDDGLLTQMKDGVKTLLQTLNTVFRSEHNEIPENKCKQMYNAASCLPTVRLQ